MADGLLYPLILALITAAGGIAYKHPKSFRIPALMFLFFACLAGAYLVGYQNAGYESLNAVRQAKSRPAMEVMIGSATLRRGTLNVYVMIGVIIDLVFLSLPFWLNKDEK